MTSTHRPLARPLLLALLALGCSKAESDETPSDPGGGDPGDPGDPFLFFEGSLHAVDPADPTAPLTLTTAEAVHSAPLVAGTLDPATARVADAAITDVLYSVGPSLRITRPEKVEGESSPANALLLADFGSDVIELEPAVDYQDGERSLVVARLQDGRTAVVHPPSGQAALFPGSAPPLTSLVDPATGALLGWIQVEGGVQLNFVGTDLLQRDLGNALGSTRVVQTRTDLCYVVTNAEVFRLDLDTLGLVGPDTFFQFEPALTTDGTSLFAAESDNAQVRIRRVDPDGSVEELVAFAVTGGFALGDLRLVGDRLLFFRDEADAGTLYSVGTDGEGLVELASDVDLGLGVLSAGGAVFFNTDVETDPAAHACLPDGSEEAVFPDALWVGSSTAELGLVGPDEPARLFLVQLSAGGTVGGGTLYGLDANELAGTVTELGTLPQDVIGLSLGGGLRDQVLATALVQSGTTLSVSTDVLYLDAAVEGSLRRVTDTPGEFELPVVY